MQHCRFWKVIIFSPNHDYTILQWVDTQDRTVILSIPSPNMNTSALTVMIPLSIALALQRNVMLKTLSVLGYLIRIQYKQVTITTKQTCFVPEDK